MFTCPVCQFEGLEVTPYKTWPPPRDVKIGPPYVDFLGKPSYEVCPRCGFEFGNDDNPGVRPPLSFQAYRERWTEKGKPWFDKKMAAKEEDLSRPLGDE